MFKNKNLIDGRWVKISILILTFCLFIVLILFNFTVISVLIVGFIVGRYFAFLVQVIKWIRKGIKKKWVWSLLLLLLLSLLPIPFKFKSGFIKFPFNSPSSLASYKITLFPVNNLEKFKVVEEIKFNYEELEKWLKYKSKLKNELSLDRKKFFTRSRQVSIINIGLLLKEVYIEPLNLESDDYFNLKVVNGISLKNLICEYSCPEVIVELVDFPTGSFYQAKGVENLTSSNYLGAETVKWSIDNIESGIRFAYISPPYYHLRRFFNPFLKIAYANKWIIVTTGGIIAFIFTPKFNQSINIKNIATSDSKFISQPNNFTNNLQGALFSGSLINANTVTAHEIGGNITNYTWEQKKNLAEVSEEIQQFLYQLSKTNITISNDTITEAIHSEIQRNPKLKASLQLALQIGGLEALKAIFNHQVFSIPTETIKGWLEAE